MFCSKCGTKLEEGAKFCPECGATVENQKNGNTIEGVSGVYVDNTTPPVENVVTKTNGVNNKSIRNIIIGVVIVAVIGFLDINFY
ncbi:zinc ribbon domain-containing protein [Coprobacillaceae bacterium CR2/5/TPMF4]|nr:zinc ribbon domain-containing protein [Coprobacillaceae bacterium CR2/5/TPMF4]